MSNSFKHNHFISFGEASLMTQRYRYQCMMPGDVCGGMFHREAIEELLNQPGCVGIRYYFGVNEADQQKIILVGVDKWGNDMIGQRYLCIDNGTLCPPHCSNINILNSD